MIGHITRAGLFSGRLLEVSRGCRKLLGQDNYGDVRGAGLGQPKMTHGLLKRISVCHGETQQSIDFISRYTSLKAKILALLRSDCILCICLHASSRDLI